MCIVILACGSMCAGMCVVTVRRHVVACVYSEVACVQACGSMCVVTVSRLVVAGDMCV